LLAVSPCRGEFSKNFSLNSARQTPREYTGRAMPMQDTWDHVGDRFDSGLKTSHHGLPFPVFSI
jgi:hypothetical protein